MWKRADSDFFQVQLTGFMSLRENICQPQPSLVDRGEMASGWELAKTKLQRKWQKKPAG